MRDEAKGRKQRVKIRHMYGQRDETIKVKYENERKHFYLRLKDETIRDREKDNQKR